MTRITVVLLGALAAFAEPAGATGALDTLVTRVGAAVRDGGEEPQMLGAIESALGEYLEAGGPGAAERRPHPGLDVTTYLLHVEESGSFSIAALVIRPGGATPIHDHGTWTVWGTLEGRDRELRYARGTDLRLPVFVASRELERPSVSRVPGPPDDLHRLENAGESVSVSIHVHGADMTKQVRRSYDPDRGRVVSFVQSYVSAEGERR